MKKKRKLSTNEKFLIGFIIVLILAISFNWRSFSERLKTTYNKYHPSETTAE